MKKIFLFMILTFMLSFPVNASNEIYISEISFLNPEYVEIYSDYELNLSKSLFYDDAGIDKANNLELLQIKNTNLYLIIGNSFLEKHNTSLINATIYTTKKTGIGYYGLKDSGEDIFLNINESLNLSWIKDEDYQFNEFESLHYDKNLNLYFKSILSPAEISTPGILSLPVNSNNSNLNESDNIDNINNSVNINYEIGNSNISSNFSNVTPPCNFFFEIIPFQNLTFDKIEFKFNTNISEFQIEYYIENYLGEIVKNKINTTNLNKKSYTPKSHTDLYYIKANIYHLNCTKNDSKLVTYYNQNIQSVSDSKSTSSNSNQIENKQENSHILILNEDEIINFSSNILKYEIYRGNTLKRTFYFYLNNKKISSFELEKYSKIKGLIELENLKSNNTLTIEGLDLVEQINFIRNITNINSTYLLNLNSNTKMNNFYDLNILELNSSKIYFNFSTNVDNLDIICYINNLRTKVSNEINIKNKNLTAIIQVLEIDNSKLKETKINYSLKLYCKYKKEELKTFNYISKDFNYTISDKLLNNKNNINLSNNYDENDMQFFNSYLQNSNYLSSQIEDSNKDFLALTTKNSNLEQEIIVYESNNSKSKTNSMFYILIGLSLVTILFIVLW